MDFLELNAVTKDFPSRSGPPARVMDGVSLAVRQGEFMAVLGPSGCGKSTLLQMAAGLLPVSAGEVRIAGRRISAPPPEAVYVFQQYTRSLLPWRNVRDNVGFAVEHRLGRRRARDVAEVQLGQVGLAGFGDHFPWQLSGGMQQRVAIARALAAEPAMLLMDEPFSAVDALTRLDLQALILDIWTRRQLTVLLVTHDVEEAITLADRIAVLTQRPASVAQLLEVGIARPRDPVTTRELPRFLQLRHQLLNTLLARHEA
ncbi:NitT/TauT family transport system ATP-binding protein [Humitalea rosea]|uniref:NitT/TauT family transport system ATP-binding protein n=1 Tax=Humitalea rosea TaxID=990373 RepID=A0A2W7KAY6_9PROT|nr:ABC transporter ATP-binding protein [Humitalea rosea]PZW44760.1 NitT/TauT family transport system ATP-binding protein [Humitalea rosea]